MNESSDLLKPDEVARRMRVSKRTVIAWSRGPNPRLRAVWLGTKTVRFRPEDVEALLEALIEKSSR